MPPLPYQNQTAAFKPLERFKLHLARQRLAPPQECSTIWSAVTVQLCPIVEHVVMREASAGYRNSRVEFFGRKDSLVVSRYQSPSSLILRFNDGKQFTLPISKIPIDSSRLDWKTASASSTGEQMVVLGIKGDEVPIDAGTLRCLVDDDYAAEVKTALAKLRLSRAQRAELARDMPPAPDWLFEPTLDARRESWK